LPLGGPVLLMFEWRRRRARRRWRFHRTGKVCRIRLRREGARRVVMPQRNRRWKRRLVKDAARARLGSLGCGVLAAYAAL
jgi:hypothetical protein